MSVQLDSHFKLKLDELKSMGLFKEERILTSSQKNLITVGNLKLLNFCSNNYLGLANDPEILQGTKDGLDRYGFGLASVRFICGTQTVHKELEARLSTFLGTEDSILYSSCFDANGGLFETLFDAHDAIISDALNHASIIDGIRLTKANRFRFLHNDMDDLEKQLKEAKNHRFRLIATDGVFSMDGTIANLKNICDLADRYDALVMVDDCHATGFLGKNGRGSHEYCDVMSRIDILTGTFGKALGGASGGYISSRKHIIEWLRQRSRPYLFSNTLAPCIAAASIAALNKVESGSSLRTTLHLNSSYFRQKLSRLGFNLIDGSHPIIPIMLGDAQLTEKFAREMMKEKIYVSGFSYPVVPEGKARIRTQMSAAHTKQDLDQALTAFETVGKRLKILPT